MFFCIFQPDFNVNEVIEGRTALHFAADYGHVEVIERLLEAGANINVSRSMQILKIY